MRRSWMIAAGVLALLSLVRVPACAQGSRGGSLPYGAVPPSAQSYANLPPTAVGPGSIGNSFGNTIGGTIGTPVGTPYMAPSWGRYGDNGWTPAPAPPPPVYGVDQQGNLFYTDPRTGRTQYYGTGETRYRNRFVPAQ